MKTCSKCKKDLSLSFFNKNASKKDGYATYCKLCWAEYYKDYYKQPKERSRLDKAKELIREVIRNELRYAKNKPCMDCGQSYPYYVMDFDHRDPSKKLFNLADSVTNGKSLKEIREEIAKCDIVCSNCHRIRTYSPVV